MSKYIPKTITIRKDQKEWLNGKGSHINLSRLVQVYIDREMKKSE